MIESRRAIGFIIGTLAVFVALLGAVAWLNWCIDPFQQYRLADAGHVRFLRVLQRYINPGIAKNADYDFVITGSSLMENYDLAEVNRLCKAKSVNLAMAAMSAFEQREILEVALRHRQPRRVVMSLDFNSFAPPIDASLPEIPDPLPLYLYDDNPLNDFRYLISGPVTLRTLAIVADARIGSYSTDSNRAWSWDRETIFSRAKMLKDIDPADINKRFHQGSRNIEHMRASFETNIAALIAAHPDTQFNLVFPPYSIVVWADFVQRRQLDVSLAFKRFVFERLRSMPNARIFDMQADAAITHNLELYTDIYHFNSSINRRLMETACDAGPDPGYRVTENNLPMLEEALRAQAMAVDAAALKRQ